MPRLASGFTLIEMLIVLLVASAIAGLAIPRMDPFEADLRATTHSVGMALLSAQRQAIQGQHDVVVAFDTGTGILRIHEDTNNDGAISEGERVRSVSLGERVVFGLGGATPRGFGTAAVSFTKRQGGLPAITFHRNGSAGEGGSFYLTSRRAAAGSHAGETWAVEVERATGRASWFSHRDGAWRRAF
jgi:prepilin-type N-terminal cleavage/methylation domain-containing protein